MKEFFKYTLIFFTVFVGTIGIVMVDVQNSELLDRKPHIGISIERTSADNFTVDCFGGTFSIAIR